MSKPLEMSDKELAEKAVEFLTLAAKKLNEVETGEDFECECWELANQIEAFLAFKTYDPNE